MERLDSSGSHPVTVLPVSSSTTTTLANAGASVHTRRAYRGDLIAFASHHGEEIGALTAAPIRAFLAELADLSPASRKRKRAAVASFTKWAVRHDLLAANPMDRIDTVKVPKNLPRLASAADVAKVLAVICSRRPRKDLPLDRLRDRVLFETAYVCGARASEVCGLYVEDSWTARDTAPGRCSARPSTAAADLCPTTPPITAGRATAPPPVSRSTSTGCVMPTPASSSTPACSIEAVRRRLGHASTETTQLYALLDDKVADAEIRAARRRRDRAAR
ncbi:site-specific integrase [Nonomuraea bangladeshensis]